jgi:hypothetical protein
VADLTATKVRNKDMIHVFIDKMVRYRLKCVPASTNKMLLCELGATTTDAVELLDEHYTRHMCHL